jgi:RHS repeat-associated protein
MAAEPVRFLTKSLLGSRFVHPDHLGTPRVITASTALAATTGTGITSPQTVNKAVWRWDSDPFGSNATANSAPNENPNTLSQVVGTATLPYLFGFDLAFPGQKRDRETGKHYNYFRDYDPSVGRYFESDPIGLRGGWSTFGYVESRPISITDTQGLMGGGGCHQGNNCCKAGCRSNGAFCKLGGALVCVGVCGRLAGPHGVVAGLSCSWLFGDVICEELKAECERKCDKKWPMP